MRTEDIAYQLGELRSDDVPNLLMLCWRLAKNVAELETRMQINKRACDRAAYESGCLANGIKPD